MNGIDMAQLQGLSQKERRRALDEWCARWIRETSDEDVRRVLQWIFSKEEEPEQA